jgi:hypothetical protein
MPAPAQTYDPSGTGTRRPLGVARTPARRLHARVRLLAWTSIRAQQRSRVELRRPSRSAAGAGSRAQPRRGRCYADARPGSRRRLRRPLPEAETPRRPGPRRSRSARRLKESTPTCQFCPSSASRPNDMRISCGPSSQPAHRPTFHSALQARCWPSGAPRPLRPVGCMRGLGSHLRPCQF